MDKKNKQAGEGQQGKNQYQGNQQRKNEPTSQKGSESHARQQQPGSQDSKSEQQSQRSGNEPSVAQQSGKSEQTITNQDQQRQATNAGDSNRPMGEEETEGDRQREERLKPYKNVGDDSGETDKKTPTMK